MDKKLFALNYNKDTLKLEIYETNKEIYDNCKYEDFLFLSSDIGRLKTIAKNLKDEWIKSAEVKLNRVKNTKVKIWDKNFQEHKKEDI